MQHDYSVNCGIVLLRPLSHGDIQLLRAWRNDKPATKYLRPVGYITEQMQEEWYEKYLADPNILTFAIEETESLKRTVGSVSLYDFNGRQAEFGKIQVGDCEAHGRGIGLLATALTLKVAFEILKLSKVVATVNEMNAAAYGIYKKVGFKAVGRFPSVAAVGGTEIELEMDLNDYNDKCRPHLAKKHGEQNNGRSKMLNFAVGPVMMQEEILDIGARQIPYFRTSSFSEIMLENEDIFLSLLNAPDGSRAIFMTGSGTASMEATVMNALSKDDKALVVNGGTFGARFCEICDIHSIKYDAIVCEAGKTLTREQLYAYDGKGYTAFLVNLCETSTGVLYDLELISEFCRKNGIFLIVDAISAFLCDEIDMSKYGIDIVITGSQKALALAPGLSLVALNGRAISRMEKNSPATLYFDFKRYLADGGRGQTPFTPAVGILLQLNARLKQIKKSGGAEYEIKSSAAKAKYFRSKISSLPFEIFADNPSNCVTSLVLKDESRSAYRLFEILMNEYNIWICPNGGSLKEKVFRVGHMGALGYADYDKLISALKEAYDKSNNLRNV